MTFYLLCSVAFVTWVALFGFSFVAIVDGEVWWARVVGILLLVMSIALALWGVNGLHDRYGNRGPCFREETGMAYNPATKTSMSYTHCVDRGTWVQ